MAEGPQGTISANVNFDIELAAKMLKKAMKGLGTDEKVIIEVLVSHNNDQRQEIKTHYKTMYGKDLQDDLSSELGGHFENVCLSLLIPPRMFDVKHLKRAMDGIGTVEKVLVEVLCTRNQEEIEMIKNGYKQAYDKDLEADVTSETSGQLKRLLVSMLAGGRDQTNEVDPAAARKDAEDLYQAGAAKLGTDESTFNAVLATRNMLQICEVCEAYAKLSGNDIIDAVKSEFSGDTKEGYLAIVKCARNPPAYFAECVKKAIAGAGTDDDSLIRILVSRSEVDLQDIKKAYQIMYTETLNAAVSGDTSGDYKKILLEIVGPE
ncbi:PREDICTED: annexin A7-like [Priapulus caudatus]|uniref:Annexin n=1 Tax=Priapulus caudatus TaxID=37621 RepID=A0ABM1EQT3_PRICU|nr:PREDICTED: annexin A7-like [Priapulus caudatus]